MPRPKSSIPPYRHHKSTGRAVVYIGRKTVSLGPYDSPESRQQYAEIVSKITAGETVEGLSSKPAPRPASKTVAGLCLRFIAEELPKYSDAEQHCFRGAMKILGQLFGETPANDFGPIRLRAVRKSMVDGDPNVVTPDGKPKPRKPWSRSFINKQVKRLKYLFRWGVSWELAPAAVAEALGTVKSLTAGETDAREGTPRRAVPDKDLAAVRAVLCQKHQDLFDLLLLTGARPGEIVGLTTGVIDRSGEVWRVDLAQHKTAHKGKSRTLFFNATAQAILLRYLKADPDASLFQIQRKTLGTAIKDACTKVGVPPFTSHWLRHTVATKLADDVGTEAAQRLLGHAGKAMTEHYSRKAEKVAIDAAKRLG